MYATQIELSQGHAYARIPQHDPCYQSSQTVFCPSSVAEADLRLLGTFTLMVRFEKETWRLASLAAKRNPRGMVCDPRGYTFSFFFSLVTNWRTTPSSPGSTITS